MATMAQISTDKRVDDLRVEMHEGFARSDKRIDDLRSEMHRGFDGVDQRFDRVETDIRELRADTKAGFAAVTDRFDSVNARLDSMLKLMIGFFATAVGSVLATVAARIVLHF
jgi:hypothetical protein